MVTRFDAGDRRTTNERGFTPGVTSELGNASVVHSGFKIQSRIDGLRRPRRFFKTDIGRPPKQSGVRFCHLDRYRRGPEPGAFRTNLDINPPRTTSRVVLVLPFDGRRPDGRCRELTSYWAPRQLGAMSAGHVEEGERVHRETPRCPDQQKSERRCGEDGGDRLEGAVDDTCSARRVAR